MMFALPLGRLIPRFSLALLAPTVLAAGRVLAAEPAWEPAPRADDFVDSVGITTHWSYAKLPYGKDFEGVKRRLAESGIRHLRDEFHPRETELYRDLGLRTMILSEPHRLTLPEQIAAWKAAPGVVEMIEGPNEPNNFWPRQNMRYQGEPWPKGCKLWQDDLYKTIRADPALTFLKVTSPTPIFDGVPTLAPLTSFDYLAIHPYAGGEMPSTSIAWGGRNLRGAYVLLGTNTDAKRIVVTESGYHNCLAGAKVLGGAQSGISETAGGRYFPRHFAEYWNEGIARTYLYEFVDETVNPDDPEQNFGLLRNDLSPKPSFTALANLLALLGESRWDKAAARWVRPDAPERAVRLAVDGPAHVHHTTLSRADGSIDLLLWQEVSSYDLKTKKDLSPPVEQVTVRLSTPLAATLYHPLAGTAAQRTFPASASIIVAVPDEVVVLRLAAPAIRGNPPAVPADLSAAATAMGATLKWRSPGAAPAAFVVSRLGKYIGTVVPGADGSASFTDDALLPGYGFPYAVRAVGADGLLSPAAEIVARTPDLRPDLVVTAITCEPSHPKAGDEIHFSGTVANKGVAATPDNVTVGLTFSADNKVVGWCDTFKGPLKPGESRTLVPNNGPGGKATWTCPEGTFYVKAIADDVGRITESSKLNNAFLATISTGRGPDFVIAKVTVPATAAVGQPANLTATIRNVGTGPNPDKTKLYCKFILIDPAGTSHTLGWTGVVRVFAPGDQTEITLDKPWTPTEAGKFQIVVQADSMGHVAEINDKNNGSAPVAIEVK